MLAVFAALNLNRPILAGHSIAGEELSSIGSRRPERVAGLIYLEALSEYAFYDRSKGNLIIDADELRRKLARLVTETDPLAMNAEIKELLQASLPHFENDLKAENERRSKVPKPPTESIAPAKTPELSAVDKAVLLGMGKYTEIKAPVLAMVELPHDLGPESKEDPVARAADATEFLFLKAFEDGVPTAHVVRLAHADHYIYESNGKTCCAKSLLSRPLCLRACGSPNLNQVLASPHLNRR